MREPVPSESQPGAFQGQAERPVQALAEAMGSIQEAQAANKRTQDTNQACPAG